MTSRSRAIVGSALSLFLVASAISVVQPAVAADDTNVTTLQDFQGDVPISTTDPVGFFTWGSTGAEVTLGVKSQERADAADNRVLAGSYLIPAGGYGGFSYNLAESSDWSGYGGLRFWWYASQSTNPASPTAGADIKVEIKDGGPDGEHSELWTTTFKDNWGSSTSRWKLVELPFESFTLGSYQPGSAETQNGTLDLTQAWGFAPTLVPGTAAAVDWAIDDVQLYGTPAPKPVATVAATQDVYLVDAGGRVKVTVALTTPKDVPLAEPVALTYGHGAPGGDSTDNAAVGTNYRDFGGTLKFAAGTPSGTTKSFTIRTLKTGAPDVARSISVVLSGDGVELPAAAPRVVINAHGLPYLNKKLSIKQRVADLLKRMSLTEKIGQMAQAERLGLGSAPSQIATLGLGSVLSGGGSTPASNTPEGWANMIDGFQLQALSTRLQVPLLYGVDAVHGHNNLVGATIFPHNIGLGATRDPALVQKISTTTASETRATGPNWAFAPCLCVTRDERWGRSYESFGEDPALVRTFAKPTIVGLQGKDPTSKRSANELLATAKHWAGDGGTSYDPSQAGTGYPIDQGVTHAASAAEFIKLHVTPYEPAIAAGVGSIMPSYSAVDFGDGPVRMHENTALNTDLLKKKMGFSGFLISDWEGIDKLPGGTYTEKVARSVNSGLDMAMAPYNFGAFITSMQDNVASGAVKSGRVDDAVKRILTQKFELGLFEQPFTNRRNANAIGSDAHREIARQAVAESQVLLKNEGVLPLSKSASIYVAGSNANDLGNQSGGWTVTWQGSSGPVTDGTTILGGIEEVAPAASITYSADASAPLAGHDVGVVVVGETPYSEGVGDVGNNGHSLSLSDADRATIDTVCGAMKCVVLVVAGRTQLVTDKLADIDGLVASFLPGSEGAGVADVLFGEEPFTGRLPLTWPKSAEQVPINVGDASYAPLYPYGWGERTDFAKGRLQEVVAQLKDNPGSGTAAVKNRAARAAIGALLKAKVWNPDGSVSRPEVVLPVLQVVATLVPATGTSADLLVSVARDFAQDAIGSSTAGATAVAKAQAWSADAEHRLAAGKPAQAVALLAKVVRAS